MDRAKTLFRYIRRHPKMPKHIKKELIKALKDVDYKAIADTIAILDKSPKSLSAIERFNKLDPSQIRDRIRLNEFIEELKEVRNEISTCTINPYFYLENKITKKYSTIGNILVPNSKEPVSLNEIVRNKKYNYLDKPRMVKDYLMLWNRDASNFLEERRKSYLEYLNKSHRSKYVNLLLNLACVLSFLSMVYGLTQFFHANRGGKISLLILATVCTFAVIAVTEALVNTHHRRKLAYYDKLAKKLDSIYDGYVDHTFTVEEKTMDKVYSKKACNYSLHRANVLAPLVKGYDIESYVYSHKAIARKKYFLLNALSFVAIIVSIAAAVILFTL